MNIINLTPHDINIFAEDLKMVCTIQSSGIARASTVTTKTNPLFLWDYPIPVNKVEFGLPEGLPENDGYTKYIVSIITANAGKECGMDTDHLYLVGQSVRDLDGIISASPNALGKIVGCTNLVKFS